MLCTKGIAHDEEHPGNPTRSETSPGLPRQGDEQRDPVGGHMNSPQPPPIALFHMSFRGTRVVPTALLERCIEDLHATPVVCAAPDAFSFKHRKLVGVSCKLDRIHGGKSGILNRMGSWLKTEGYSEWDLTEAKILIHTSNNAYLSKPFRLDALCETTRVMIALKNNWPSANLILGSFPVASKKKRLLRELFLRGMRII